MGRFINASPIIGIGRLIKKIAVGLLCVSLLFLHSVTVFAAPDEKNSDIKGPEETQLSLYDTQTALSSYVNSVLGVNGNDKHHDNRVEATNEIAQNHQIGNAGAYIGYGDEEAGFSSFIMSNISYGVSTSTYDAWQHVTQENDNQVYAYARFGHLLRETGFDAVASVNKTSFRSLIGMMTMLFFGLAQMVPVIFGFALKVLKFLNPFGFLANITTVTGYWKSAFPDAPQQLIAFVDWFSQLFDWIVNDLTWLVTVPVMLAMTAVSILLLRQDTGSRFLKLAKKIVFFAIGIPICAGLYTNVLNEMFDIMTNNSASTQVVASTIIDFESWVTNNNLAIPSGVLLESLPGSVKDGGTEYTDVNGGIASDETLLNLRKSAYMLNQTNNEGLQNLPDVSDVDSFHFSLSGNLWNKDGKYTPEYAVEQIDDDESIEYGREQAFKGMTTVEQDLEVTDSLMRLLWRYTKGAFYRPSDFETHYMNVLTTTYRNEMGHMGSVDSASSNEGTVYEMFDRTNDVNDWMEREVADNEKIWRGTPADGFHLTWVNKDWNIYTGGTLESSSLNPKEKMVFTSTGKGLSTQSMYNFLCTSFDDNSLMVYSSDRSVSENSRQLHYSANMVGSGALNVAMAANMLVMLIVLVIIAFAFSVKTAFHNLKRGFSMIAAIPFAMVGAVKSIAQVVSYTLAMILELIVTAFLYLFISDLMVIVAMAVEQMISQQTVASPTILALASLNGFQMGQVEAGIIAAVIIETLLVAGICMLMLCYRHVWFRARNYVSLKGYKAMTLPGMECAYEAAISGKKQKLSVIEEQNFSFLHQVHAYLQIA